LLASLATLGLLVYSVLAECVWPQWRRLREQYAQTLRAQATDERGRALADQFEVAIQQSVLPALRTVDRCTTCHPAVDDPRMTSQPHPFRTHPGDFLRVHQPDSFGCTPCHGGQGRATESGAAHGQVKFWPAPMIPTRYAYAGCGSCHTPVQVPTHAALRRGRDAVTASGCLTCHTLDGAGGARTPDPAGQAGPDLSQVGAAGYDADWHAKHARRAAAAGGAAGSALARMDEPVRAEVALFLGSRVGAPALVEGKALFHSFGCRGCHRVNGVGGKEGPDLSRVGEKDPGHMDFSHIPGERTLANWFAAHFREPAAVVPGSQMPVQELTEEQIEGLTLYMLSLRRSSVSETYRSRDRIRVERFGEREFATDGAALYATFCSGCHGAEGQGMHYPGMPVFPAVANPGFLAVASDRFIAHTVQYGRPGRRMPAWGEKEGGLRPGEIQAIVAHLRALGGVAEPEPDSRPERWVGGDAVAGEGLFTAHCVACHGARGQGGEGPALGSKVFLAAASDTYLVQTISRGRRGTVMVGFAEPSTIHPTLAPADIEALVSYLRTLEKAGP
jgi:mono/diheme cytochrome c family protein